MSSPAPPSDGPTEATPSRRRGRRLRAAAIVLCALVGVVAVDAAVLYARLDRVAFRTGPDRPGTTFVLIGSDSRQFVATPEQRAKFGSVPGERADVVLILHVPESGRPRMLAIPRDLLVFADSWVPRRLNVTMIGTGVQGTSDALCRSLGIAADHVAIVGFDGFQRLIDSVGGIEVDVHSPMRDAYTGLDVTTAGRQRLAGDAALAYVRSRHAEVQVDGSWQPATDGAASRPDRAGEVIRAIGGRAKGNLANPIATQRTAWSLSSSVRVDGSMRVAELTRLARALAAVQRDPTAMSVLPATTTATKVPIAEIGPSASEALRTVGVTSLDFSRNACSPSLLTAVRASHATLPDEDGQ